MKMRWITYSWGILCLVTWYLTSCSSVVVTSSETQQNGDGSLLKDANEYTGTTETANQPPDIDESPDFSTENLSSDPSTESSPKESVFPEEIPETETSTPDSSTTDLSPLDTQTSPEETMLDTKPCPSTTSSDLSQVSPWNNLSLTPNPQSKTMPACGVQGFRMVGAATAEYEIHVKDFAPTHDMKLTVYNARAAQGIAPDKPLEQVSSQGRGWLVGKFTIDQSGEISLVLDSRTYPQPATYTIQIFCIRNCHLSATRFPIILMHGFAGTDKYFGFLDYFYQVKPHLEKLGYAVFTPSVQPIANSTQRVFTLKTKIDDIFKQTGARKLNLIAHSQGGIDGRLLISFHNYGDVIASLTTISTPHRGIPIPNLLIPPSQELSESNMQQYNQLYPNDPRVAYFSYAGVSCGILDSTCRKKYNDETIDPLLIATFNTLKSLRGDNDGVVPVSSAKWGTFLGEIPADHWDEIGQVADTNNKAFSHKTFYENEAIRLQKLDY